MTKAAGGDADAAARERIRERSGAFLARCGRRPRILQLRFEDGESGFAAVARGYADLGFDVDISSAVHSSAQAAGMAVDNDVHAVEASCSAESHQRLVGELAQLLHDGGRPDLAVVARGGFGPEESLALRNCGVSLLCSAQAPAVEVAEKLLDLLDNGRPIAGDERE